MKKLKKIQSLDYHGVLHINMDSTGFDEKQFAMILHQMDLLFL